MDIKRNDSFLPVVILTEDIEKIAIMKAALRSFTNDHERGLLSMQRRIKAGKRQIDICTQESNAIDLQLSAVETKITRALMLTQESELEALKTVKANRNIKRKVVALKNDLDEQEKILQRANETLHALRKSYDRRNKKLKVLPEIIT